MTIRSLQIFLSVSQLGSMRKAAEVLFISQPAISLAISEIEKEYDVVLFDRSSHNLRLTQTGVNLMNYAESLLSIQTEIDKYLHNESLSHRIRIGATVTVGACVLSHIIEQLNETLKNLEHEVLVANTYIIEDRIFKGDLDISLVEGYIKNPNLEVKNVIKDRLVCVCSTRHRFMGRESICIEELGNEPLILREIGSGTREQLENMMAKRNLVCNIKWSCYSFDAIKDAIFHNLGVSVMSERLIRRELERGELWVCNIEGDDFIRTFKLVYHKNKLFTNAINAFAQACIEFGVSESLS